MTTEDAQRTSGADERRSDRRERRPLLLLVGWDGATPDLLERFVTAGKLPTLQRLIAGGSFRRLRSTVPPVTACAWSSFLSGRNPGKHGLYDFVTPRKDTYRFDYTNGGFRKDRNDDMLAWLNRSGLKVGCVNVPMTYPPRPIDGFMISGLDAPDEKSGIAYPTELFDDAQRRTGDYRIDNRHLGNMCTEEDRRRALAEFKRIETLRTDVTLAMLERVAVDVLIIVYNATDQVQHHFWHLMDAEHPQFPGADSPEVTAFHDAIEDIYAHCDRELARLIEAFPEADGMLMSDHGAGPTTGPRVRLNNVLADAGLLTWAESKGGLKSDLVSAADRFLRRTLSAKQKAMLARLLPGGRTAIESMALPSIDWSRTTAFVYEGFTLAPCVWINRRDMFPQGTVAPGAEYESACRRVTETLTNLKDPRTGKPVIPRVYRADEVYHGQCLPTAPDLILDWWEGRTFTITASHPKLADEPAVFYPGPVAIPGQDITGIHRRDGVLAAWGPHVAREATGWAMPTNSDGGGQCPSNLSHDDHEQTTTARSPANLIDLAPTALALLGLPVPNDVDGRVLNEVVAGKIPVTHATQADMKADPATGTSEQEEESTGYSDEESALVRKRLSSLGYLE